MHTIHTGDVLDILPTLPSDYFHGMLSDPPYELGFMSKKWDKTGIAFDARVWAEIYRVLMPGAYLLAFGGSRTFHRLTCAIEDAGFEIRDHLMWLYGTGFPKSKSCLKPAYEPIILARKPMGRTKKAKALNVDACRIASEAAYHDNSNRSSGPLSNYDVGGRANSKRRSKIFRPAEGGRWPANVLLDETAAEMLDEQTGKVTPGLNIDACRIGTEDMSHEYDRTWNQNQGVVFGGRYNQGGVTKTVPPGRWPANVLLDEDAAEMLDAQTGDLKAGGQVSPDRKNKTNTIYGNYQTVTPFPAYGDNGGASRFFYCSKASKKEREAGLTTESTTSERPYNNGEGFAGRTNLDGQWVNTSTPRSNKRNPHPCVKPLDVCQWLATLILPQGESSRLLVPFSGSGSEMIGGLQAGWGEVTGIERDPTYIQVAEARLRHHCLAL